MGSYSGGDNQTESTDSEDQESTEGNSQAGIDDYTGDGGDDSEQDSSADETAAAGVAGAVATAVGAGAASGAGSAAGAAGTAGAGADAGAEPPECEDAEDTGESEDQNSETEGTKQPESPEIEDPRQEDDSDEPEKKSEPEDHEEKDTNQGDDADTDGENQEDEEADENDENDEEDEDEDEVDETLVLVQRVDPLSAMSWAVQPVMKRVEECYADEVEVIYKPAPIRDLDPTEEKQHWNDVGQQLEMPVDPSFWDDTPPESTALLTKAFEAANRQQCGIDFIRALWRRGVAAGHGIANREFLIDLASDLGLDQQQFEADLDTITPDSTENIVLPKTHLQVHDMPISWTGRVRYTDFKTQFTFQGVDEQEPQDLEGFVNEHGPVATAEVIEVYDIHREKAVESLQKLTGVSSFEIGAEQFWNN